MNRATIRKAYRDAIVDVFGCNDKKLDKDLIRATGSDIYLGGKDPGQHSSGETVLSIYCENGIPNATDYHSFIDFGGGFVDNSERWSTVDDIVNLLLDVTGKALRVYHEPVNGGVVNIYEV